jgi:hypothetical protein
MTRFIFDARAALERARRRSSRPNRPNLPNQAQDAESPVARHLVAPSPEEERRLTLLAQDMFEERAAIREYDGGQSRCHAEADARADVYRATGLSVQSE